MNPFSTLPAARTHDPVRAWMRHSDAKTLLRCYPHEFEAVRGGRQIEREIAQIDAAFGG